jgi:hypothetical protein
MLPKGIGSRTLERGAKNKICPQTLLAFLFFSAVVARCPFIKMKHALGILWQL